MIKLKNSDFDETKKNQIVMNVKNQIVIKTQKLKLWQNSKIQNVTKLKNLSCDTTQILTKPNNSKCEQTQIVTKLKNSNCDKTSLNFWQNLNYCKSQFWSRKTNLKVSFRKTILTAWQLMQCSLGSALQFLRSLYSVFVIFC